MKTLIRIEWLTTRRVEMVSLMRYLAMSVEALEGTRATMIEVRASA